MTSIAPSAFTTWDNSDDCIRVTGEGQPSVIDLIKMYQGHKCPHKTWHRLKQKFPQLTDWVQYVKFTGSGQRPTPVLVDVKNVDKFLNICSSYYSKHLPIVLKKEKPTTPITERNMQEAICRLLTECGEQPKQYVPCTSGIADIVTDCTVIEVKTANQWKQAIGQAIVYSRELLLLPEIAIFGDANFAHILDVCTNLRVACTCYPLKSALTLGMFEDLGTFSHNNYDRLGLQIKVERLACCQ